MASKTAGASSSSACTANIPAPPAKLHLTRITWKKGRVLHRVHDQAYGATSFHPGGKGNARFSPIWNRTVAPETPIATLYGGETFQCALLETVFHDVPFAPGFKSYDKRKLAGLTYSVLVSTSDLVLADLSNVALRKLGIPRSQLIDTEKSCYQKTRAWAEAIYTQAPEVQGLFWTSRQDDSARALMLFGDRVAPGVLQQAGGSRSLVHDVQTYTELLDLALSIGVDIVGPLP